MYFIHGPPVFRILGAEVSYGQTMVFIKRLSTIALLNRRKEEAMVKVRDCGTARSLALRVCEADRQIDDRG